MCMYRYGNKSNLALLDPSKHQTVRCSNKLGQSGYEPCKWDDYNCHDKMQDTTEISSQWVGHHIFAFSKQRKIWKLRCLAQNSQAVQHEVGHGLFVDSRCMLLSIIVLLLTTIMSLSGNQ